ncbi:hypothetical protein NKR23_g1931 [Pleurostoma richardsiae]|uniref:Uncharacterized protein n=1 Tax=Pleurostoma richardsiae TaxID=41990 RepID=A0AA38RYA2_9PEZI|nr:hypothetical protein NKR23_g1931 [Pleurostoma richardsiae]
MRSSRKSHGPPAYGQTGWSGASPPSTPTNVSSPTVSAANWTHIKNIFPLGSDYLCNALYAHIVAYNYVASLCKSHPPPSSSRGSRHPGAPATNSSAGNGTTATAGIIRGPADETRVPKKAASLLGLSHTAAVSRSDLGAPAQRNKILIRESPSTSSELGNIKSNCSQIPGRREFTNSDSSAVADLRDGLGRCIARLVATLKLTGGEQDAPIKGANSEDLDPLLMKMLCELVRCCEEQS